MSYSQTGCSFPRNFADFRCDIGNLIGSLLRAICNWRDQFATELVEVTSNKCCYLTGDFNLDLLRYADHEPTQEFVDCLFSHMFVPLIDRPTRITAHSATLIDNIFTNHFSPSVLKGIVISDISDHLPVFAYVSDDSFVHVHKRIGNRPLRQI